MCGQLFERVTQEICLTREVKQVLGTGYVKEIPRTRYTLDDMIPRPLFVEYIRRILNVPDLYINGICNFMNVFTEYINTFLATIIWQIKQRNGFSQDVTKGHLCCHVVCSCNALLGVTGIRPRWIRFLMSKRNCV